MSVGYYYSFCLGALGDIDGLADENEVGWMKIICNGAAQEIASGTWLADYISQLGLDVSSVAVECDGKILTREEYASHALRDGSVLELIRFVGGG